MRTSSNASTSPEATPEVTAVARDLIASFGHDPARYGPGTVAVLPGTRTTTWHMACSTQCPHKDGRCHRPHAGYVGDDRVRERLVPAPRRPTP